MRTARIVIGAIIVVLAIWVVVGEQIAGASANAVVNARIVTLRTPIAGEVTFPDRQLGSVVMRGEVLASVSDPLVDAVRMNDLEMERMFVEAEVGHLEALLKTTGKVAGILGDRNGRFTDRQIAELELRLAHARDRMTLLGIEPLPDGASLRSVPASLTESRVREEVDILENALAAARDGVFIGDSYNDAPYAEQRRMELVTVIDGIKADLQATQSRLAAVSKRVDNERLAVNRLAVDDITATANGHIWEILASDGERLQRGEPLLRIVDCDTLIVTLSVAENVYNRLRVGVDGRFRFSGSGEVYDGIVTRLAGAGAATIYRNLAVTPSIEHLERFDVALSVPGLQADRELSCPVGRTGRVFFEERPLDWLRSLF